jgi:hypothetical protein
VKTVNYDEQIEKEGKILVSPLGISMMPILRQKRDIMLIEKISKPLKVKDAVLFKRESGQYVMHRIIRINKDGYDIRGDNCINTEYAIKPSQIVGIMTGFYRDEKFIDCKKNILYRTYVIFARPIYYFRRYSAAIMRRIKNCLRR